MSELSDLCTKAVKVDGTGNVYRCDYDGSCEHQTPVFDHKLYCRVPLRPDKYKPKFPQKGG